MGKKTKQWRWRPALFLFGIALFWFISMVGAGLIQRAGEPSSMEMGFIVLIMLFYAIFAAVTDKGWPIAARIAWVISAWFLQAVLTLPVVLTIGLLVYSSYPQFTDRAVSFFAALPIVVYSMHRSRIFNKPIKQAQSEEKEAA